MTQHEASRTLVKSPPELWAECSEAASLARHLGQFGEIRITRLEPETAVAWEGEKISGTVRLEPTGWGTKVILTVKRPGAAPAAPAESMAAQPRPLHPEPEPVRVPAPAIEPPPAEQTRVLVPEAMQAPMERRPSRKRGAMAWLRDFFGFGPDPEQIVLKPEPVPEPEPVPDPLTAAGTNAVVQPGIDSVSELVPTSRPEALVPAVPGADEALTAALDSLGQAHHRPFSRG